MNSRLYSDRQKMSKYCLVLMGQRVLAQYIAQTFSVSRVIRCLKYFEVKIVKQSTNGVVPALTTDLKLNLER